MQASAALDDGKVAVRVDDIPPGRAILAMVLVDPEGKETPARNRQLVTREEGSGGASGPGVGVGASGGSSSGISPYISLGYILNLGRDERRSQYLTAEITPEDMLRYASEYRDSRIEVRFRDAEGSDGLLTIPAPPP